MVPLLSRRRATGLMLLIGVSLLAACSAAGSATSSASIGPVTPTAQASPAFGFTPGTKDHPRVVVITTSDTLMFIPNAVTVAKGETVTFQIKNTGTVEHEFMVGLMTDAFADKEGTPEVAGIRGGETKSLTFTFDGPGPYAFACHAPGHFEAGMKGTITLVGS